MVLFMWEPLTLVHNVPTKWNWVVAYPDKLELALKVDIGAFTYIQAQYGITIEDDVQIGSHCSLYSISTISRSGKPIIGRIHIKRGAMIGTHSTIMPGVTIEQNEIVPAYSFVKAKDRALRNVSL